MTSTISPSIQPIEHISVSAEDCCFD